MDKNLVICPNKECDTSGCPHTKEHKIREGWDYPFTDCPACVPVEPKPDDGLLIDTNLECPYLFMMDGEKYKFTGCKTWGEAEWAKMGWDTAVAKTASIKDAEFKAQLKEIFGKLEDSLSPLNSPNDTPEILTIFKEDWQTLKKKYLGGVK